MASASTYRLPSHLSPTASHSGRSARKSWQSRMSFLSFRPNHEGDKTLRQDNVQASTTASTGGRDTWWKIRLFRGMVNDARRRAPFYWSDWRDAWDYRVIPATVYMYFANILPALAFSLDMFTKTQMSYGVNEVLLASVLGSFVFALLAAQPLVIVGVTGPITVFNYTVYDIITPRGTNYFAFMCWIGLWGLVMHWILAITNSCNGLKYVTRFSCDTFGFYVAFIYLQKGIQVLTRQWTSGESAAYLSIMVALLTLMTGYACGVVGGSSLFQRYVRKFVEDYGTPLTIIFFTGFVHIGKMKGVPIETLPTSKSFFPTQERGWFIHFWDIGVADVFLAIPFAVLLTVLFWFDHNVSSLIAQGTEFPLRKPAGFHWDIFLLGLTTGVAGLLGIPFPNGLIPQAPFHTNSLCVTRQVSDDDEEHKGKTQRVVDHVVEQRVSNLAQGLLTLGTMTGPLLVVLHLIPQGVLAGLFFLMGVQALEGNGITLKMLYLAKDRSLISGSDPLAQIDRKMAIWVFVGIELLGFGATFAITQTIAAIGFPIIILALIPIRTYLLPKYFTNEELNILDAPTASPFTMISVGGNHGEDTSNLPNGGASGDGPAQGRSEGNDQSFTANDNNELERGESSKLKKRQSSFNMESNGGDSIEMQKPGMSQRRSQSRQTRS